MHNYLAKAQDLHLRLHRARHLTHHQARPDSVGLILSGKA